MTGSAFLRCRLYRSPLKRKFRGRIAKRLASNSETVQIVAPMKKPMQLTIQGTVKGRPRIRTAEERRESGRLRAKLVRDRRKRHLEALERLRRVVAGYLHHFPEGEVREHVLARLEDCKRRGK